MAIDLVRRERQAAFEVIELPLEFVAHLGAIDQSDEGSRQQSG